MLVVKDTFGLNNLPWIISKKRDIALRQVSGLFLSLLTNFSRHIFQVVAFVYIYFSSFGLRKMLIIFFMILST